MLELLAVYLFGVTAHNKNSDVFGVKTPHNKRKWFKYKW